MNLKHYELIKELMKLVDVGGHQFFYAHQEAFVEKLNSSQAMTDNEFPGEVKAYLEANRRNLKPSTVYSFVIIIQKIFRGRAVDEIAIECHRFILSRCSARSDWCHWRESQLALAKIYQQLDTPKSNDCIRQLVNAKIARDKRESLLFVGRMLLAFSSFIAVIGSCFYVTNLVKDNFPISIIIKSIHYPFLVVSLLAGFSAISDRPRSCRFQHQRLKLQQQLLTTATSPVAPIEIDCLGGLIFQESRSDDFSDFLPTLFNPDFIKSLIRNCPWQ